jgi:hypothetical protein
LIDKRDSDTRPNSNTAKVNIQTVTGRFTATLIKFMMIP